jgi:cytidylate kinase
MGQRVRAKALRRAQSPGAFGWVYVDTGAYVSRGGAGGSGNRVLDSDEDALAELAQNLQLCFHDNGARLCLGERDISDAIRTPAVGALTSQISALPRVREIVVEQQRHLARQGEAECGGAVLEGRDIQTVVFPEAEVKVFLSA